MLKNIARYDKGIVQNETSLTEEGFIKGRAIVTRTGVFLYKNADGTIRKELRHPEDVMIPESLESIKMIPIVDGHPPERLITAENAKRLQIGFTGETVESEEPFIIANMVITDKAMVERIKDKKKNELSLGYTVDLIPMAGVYNGEPYDYKQTNIRYNHLALVDEARAGPEARIALDGDDAILMNPQELKMAKNQRKVKIDAQEYLMEEDAAGSVDKMISEKNALLKQKDMLEAKIEELENELDKAHAERDSLRDKDVHDPEKVHNPLENDEIGSNGKEQKDPIDSYGMQSHVRDYDKPTNMENHPVMSPKNEHYPKDLPHIANVDAAEVNRRVKNRVKLEKFADRYLDGQSLSRIDSMSDLDVKKKIILSLQKNAQLEGKSEAYINARFDAAIEDLPQAKVMAAPQARMDADKEKDEANANQSRLNMIRKQKDAYKGRK